MRQDPYSESQYLNSIDFGIARRILHSFGAVRRTSFGDAADGVWADRDDDRCSQTH
jgi:hypothetical protein